MDPEIVDWDQNRGFEGGRKTQRLESGQNTGIGVWATKSSRRWSYLVDTSSNSMNSWCDCKLTEYGNNKYGNAKGTQFPYLNSHNVWELRSHSKISGGTAFPTVPHKVAPAPTANWLWDKEEEEELIMAS